MDVTPQLIEQIDFSEKFRGYDPDQVDDFLERVGATIAELNNAVRDANERADRAETTAREAIAAAAAAPPPVAVAPAAPSDEEAASSAARTLMLAQRTADQLLAESRSEADQLVADARARHEHATRDAQIEAERLLADARTQADAVIRAANEEAQRELTARREEIGRQVDGLEERKQTLAADISTLEGRLGEYRDSLDRVHASIRTILDDPEALRQRPALDVDLTPAPAATPFLETTASEPVLADVFSPEPSSEAFAPVEVEQDTAPAPASPVWAEDAFAVPDMVDGSRSDSGFDGAVDVEPAAVAFDALPLSAEEPAEAPADPWGPGSWSEVIGDSAAPAPEPAAPAVAWDSVAFTPPPAEGDLPTVSFDAAFGPATESFPATGQDRYLRDLDEAVNQPTEPSDDAMTAFFEGDDVTTTKAEGRRFRRR